MMEGGGGMELVGASDDSSDVGGSWGGESELRKMRNDKRRDDVHTIIDAIHQHAIDNNGHFPQDVDNTSGDCILAQNEICRSGAGCKDGVDLSVLTDQGRYLVFIPEDPTGGSESGSGYGVLMGADRKITVCAQTVEEELISMTK